MLTQASANHDSTNTPPPTKETGISHTRAPYKALPAANIRMINDGANVGTPNPASREEEKDGQAEAEACDGRTNLSEELLKKERKDRRVDGDQVHESQREE